MILQVDKESVTIPNIPKVELVNHSTGSITMNTCSDISITIDSNPLSDIATAAPDFCQAVNVAPEQKKTLPFNELYKVFAKVSGKYIITAKTPFGDRMVYVNVSTPGMFRSALSSTFYEPIYNLFVALITFLPGHSLG